MKTQQGKEPLHRRSLPSHLLWRSVIGAPASWSGSSTRGVYIMDSKNGRSSGNKGGSSSMIQCISTDKRMFRLPKSLRDVIVQDMLASPVPKMDPNGGKKQSVPPPSSCSTIQLLSHPRIVGAAPPPRSTLYYSAGRAFSGTSNGISCMDLDRGNDGNNNLTGLPPRYLLVGSGGGDCSIALYDLSYFGSDHYLYQQSSSSSSSLNNKSSHTNSQQQHLHHPSNQKSQQSSVTHRPIARSLRHTNNNSSSSAAEENNASGVPSGHRQPLLGVKWYPGDVYGAFVSASISGEILVWDAQNFVPVFATYTHVYTGATTGMMSGWVGGSIDEGRSVAPLQCMDLPQTPEGCPNGNALLALGLGPGGRGVIQLCDAFRGGSATHELIGHGGGGVNAVAWDPCHPFRLASGGDDCTVRLWDIRKAGAAACLGVLNRENEMYNGVTNSNHDEWMTSHPRKKQKVGIDTSMSSGIESHGGPVTALAFAPGGDDLVSAGLDGRLHHWDLRPESCFVSSLSAIGGNKRSGMDPSVATGGQLVPTYFTGHGGVNKPTGASKTIQRRHPSRRNKTSLAIIQSGSRSTTTLLSTANTGGSASRGQITGYSLFGRRGKEPGGSPDFTLSGHLADATCLVPIVDGMWDNLHVGSYHDTTNHVNFLTGGTDGMVLSWGSSRPRRVFGDEIDREDDRPGHSVSQQWQSRFSGGNARVSNHPGPNQGEEPSFEDMDNW